MTKISSTIPNEWTGNIGGVKWTLNQLTPCNFNLKLEEYTSMRVLGNSKEPEALTFTVQVDKPTVFGLTAREFDMLNPLISSAVEVVQDDHKEIGGQGIDKQSRIQFYIYAHCRKLQDTASEIIQHFEDIKSIKIALANSHQDTDELKGMLEDLNLSLDSLVRKFNSEQKRKDRLEFQKCIKEMCERRH